MEVIGYVSHIEDSLHAQHLQAKALILILNCLAQTSVLAESLLRGKSYINILDSRDWVIKHTDVQFPWRWRPEQSMDKRPTEDFLLK